MKHKVSRNHKSISSKVKTTIIFNKPIFLHEAILHFQKMHNSAASSYLSKYLQSLKKPRNHTMKVFISGIKKFNKIANLSYAKREKLYGSKFSGLHYCNDLVDLWNNNGNKNVKAKEIIRTAPMRWWDYRINKHYLYLVYCGKDPSKALDKLLQGPTVIDCAMFCQLSIWFGIRYMIGNRLFNQLFGSKPFYLTQVIYNHRQSSCKPYMKNPLMPFFNVISLEKREPAVCLSVVSNHKDYSFKHPGGVDQNENCIVIGDAYTIFAPNEESSLNLTKAEVDNYLFESFNKLPDLHDKEKVNAYTYALHHHQSIHPVLKLSYERLIYLSKIYANKTISKREWLTNSKKMSEGMFKLAFDYNKFHTWISVQKKVRNNSLMLFLLLAKVDFSMSLRKIFHSHVMRRLRLDKVYDDS
jgi:hypothetical protein